MGLEDTYRNIMKRWRGAEEEEPAQQDVPHEGAACALTLICPEDFEDAVDVAQQIRLGGRIILNMEKLAPEDRRRVLNFVGGAAFTAGYNMQQLSASALILMREDDVLQNETGSELADVFATEVLVPES